MRKKPIYNLISNDPPANWKDEGIIVYTIFGSINLKKFSFGFKKQERIVDDNGTYYTSRLNFSVPSDIYIYVRLDSSLDWRWSLQYEAILTKDEKDRSSLYGNVEYGNSMTGPFFSKAGLHSTYGDVLPNSMEFKVIRFQAKLYDKLDDNKHSFGLNIELSQPDNAEEKNQWLPITIDPDITNPPPGGQSLQKMTAEVVSQTVQEFLTAIDTEAEGSRTDVTENIGYLSGDVGLMEPSD